MYVVKCFNKTIHALHILQNPRLTSPLSWEQFCFLKNHPMSENLELQIKQLIVKTLDLKDIRPEDISDEQPLMDSDLGLDSIDALELVVQIEKTFGIKLASSEAAKAALKSVSSMAEQIRACQSKPAAG